MSCRDITRVCVLTPSGRGAVAVVAVEGEAAVTAVDRYFKAANHRSLGDQLVGRIVYGHWGSRDGEDLIVCRRDAESLEIHCHGGRQSSAQIIANLIEAGCTAIDAEQWLARQESCPVTAAAHRALAQATTLRTATILLTQYHGALRNEIETVVASLADGKTTEAITRLECLLQFPEFGRHLTEPWRVVIAGQPNVGKSSLINALVGYERAIVFDQPGTTRDIVSSTTAIDGWPVELSDTAGLHETTDQIETAGMTLARERLAAADLVVWVLDAAELALHDEQASWPLAQQQAESVSVQLDLTQTQIVINKIDLANDLAKLAFQKNPRSVGTCAVTGMGVKQLLAAITARLVPSIPPSDAAIPFAAKQVEALVAAHAFLQQDDVVQCQAALQQILTS